MQIACSTSLLNIPFLVAGCDYVIVGEEFYAGGAIISQDPVQLGARATQAIPYFKAGQVVGVNNGLRGAAQFEMLTGTYGFEQGGMSSQSFAHVWAVIVIIIGNVLFYMSGHGT